jgi:hypothetical protein
MILRHRDPRKALKTAQSAVFSFAEIPQRITAALFSVTGKYPNEA